MNEELNKKLAEWAGFELLGTQFYSHSFGGDAEVETWLEPSGLTAQGGYPNFTESLDACWEWLVPKLGVHEIYFQEDDDGWQADIYYGEYWAIAETPALALCKAIEKMVRNEG